MGVCMSSEGNTRNVATGDDIILTVAFVDSTPITICVKLSDTLGAVREKVRDTVGSAVQGNIMTVRASGDAVRIADNVTVRKAKLEPKQTIWFVDNHEQARVDDLVLRGSTLLRDINRSSRGVKKGIRIERRSSVTVR